MKTFLTILVSVIISIITCYFIFSNNTNNTAIDTEFVTLKDIGQIALDENDKLKIQTFAGKNLEMLGNNVIINAGNEFIDLRVGDTSKIRIEREAIYINTEELFLNGLKYNIK